MNKVIALFAGFAFAFFVLSIGGCIATRDVPQVEPAKALPQGWCYVIGKDNAPARASGNPHPFETWTSANGVTNYTTWNVFTNSSDTVEYQTRTHYVDLDLQDVISGGVTQALVHVYCFNTYGDRLDIDLSSGVPSDANYFVWAFTWHATPISLSGQLIYSANYHPN